MREALTALHEVWTRHIVETEAPGAFLDELVGEAPRLSTPAARLRREHNEILGVITRAREVARPGRCSTTTTTFGSTACVPTSRRCSLRWPTTASAAPISIFAAYDVDIGGG